VIRAGLHITAVLAAKILRCIGIFTLLGVLPFTLEVSCKTYRKPNAIDFFPQVWSQWFPFLIILPNNYRVLLHC